MFEIGFTDGTGHRPYFLTRPVVTWLAAELVFPNWTAATVRALPEVRIVQGAVLIYLFAQSVVPTVPAGWLTFAEGAVFCP